MLTAAEQPPRRHTEAHGGDDGDGMDGVGLVVPSRRRLVSGN
jgi:hypothetical protein